MYEANIETNNQILREVGEAKRQAELKLKSAIIDSLLAAGNHIVFADEHFAWGTIEFTHSDCSMDTVKIKEVSYDPATTDITYIGEVIDYDETIEGKLFDSSDDLHVSSEDILEAINAGLENGPEGCIIV